MAKNREGLVSFIIRVMSGGLGGGGGGGGGAEHLESQLVAEFSNLAEWIMN